MKLLAVLLSVVMFVSPLLAETTPVVTKECITLSNAFILLPPTSAETAVKSTYKARVAITKNWPSWVDTNKSNLETLQSQLEANRDQIITNDTDITPLYNAMKSVGTDFTFAQVKSMAASTSAQRERILDAVKTKLPTTLSGLTDNKNPFAGSGPQPQDNYCYLTAEANDMLALAAIIALFDVPAAAALAALAGAIFLYAEYINCDFGLGYDFFVVD